MTDSEMLAWATVDQMSTFKVVSEYECWHSVFSVSDK